MDSKLIVAFLKLILYHTQNIALSVLGLTCYFFSCFFSVITTYFPEHTLYFSQGIAVTVALNHQYIFEVTYILPSQMLSILS